MTEKFRVLDGEVDLEREDVRDSQNRRIDTDYVERAVADVQARRGRRPLTDDTLQVSTRRGCRSGCPSRLVVAPRNVPAPKAGRCPILPGRRWSAISRPDRQMWVS